MKKTQVVAEHWNGKKEIFWMEPIIHSTTDILCYAKLLGFKSVKFNFGPKRKENK